MAKKTTKKPEPKGVTLRKIVETMPSFNKLMEGAYKSKFHFWLIRNCKPIVDTMNDYFKAMKPIQERHHGKNVQTPSGSMVTFDDEHRKAAMAEINDLQDAELEIRFKKIKMSVIEAQLLPNTTPLAGADILALDWLIEVDGDAGEFKED